MTVGSIESEETVVQKKAIARQWRSLSCWSWRPS